MVSACSCRDHAIHGAAKVSVLCLASLMVLALHGCTDPKEAEMIQSGQTFEAAATQTLSSTEVTQVSDSVSAVVSNPTDEQALNGLVTALGNSGLADVFDTATEKAVAKIENGLLVVNITMKPIMLVGGLVRLTRSKEDERGPIFVLNIPLLQGTQFDPAQITQDLMRTKVHIEGHIYTLFCWGYFKLLVNHQGKKFHMEVEKMKIHEVLVANGVVAVSDSNEVRATGTLKTWINDNMVAKIAQQIRDAAKPFTDEIEKAKAQRKERCDLCSSSADVQACWDCANAVFDTFAKQFAGAAFHGAAFLVEHIGNFLAQIFVVNDASFDVQIDPNNLESKIELNLDVTVFGNKIVHNYVLDVQKIDEGANEIARLFAPEIFDQPGNAR